MPQGVSPGAGVSRSRRRLLLLSERHLPGYDAEETIDNWAAERSAGVYGAGRRSGELERSGGIVKRAVFGRDAVA